jgi:hypothetical protein
MALVAVAALVAALTVPSSTGRTGSRATVPGGRAAGAVSPEATRVPPDDSAPARDAALRGLHVQGNQILDARGDPVRLRGFNSSGLEYACVEGWGLFDGPSTRRVPASAVEAMATWTGANAVRVPLNEQCWLGLGVKRAYGGANYRRAVRAYVDLLTAQGFVVILDLHRSAPGKAPSLKQEQMPDRDHSVEFWRQVAVAYADDADTVAFDLFNEPWPFGEPDSTRAWECWRDGGCSLPAQNGEGTYVAAGMSELVATIRAAGAPNLLLLGGIHWAEMLNRWLQYRPDDPMQNLAASFHNYDYNRYCDSSACYDTVLAAVAKAVPLVATEVGPDGVGPDCAAPAEGAPTGFSARILDWLDAHGAGYLAWSWNAWGDGCSLVTDYDGTPTPTWGTQVRDRLAAGTPSGTP